MKQLIALASGVLALSATFIEKLIAHQWALIVLLCVSWAALVISVLFGLETISAIVKSRLEDDDEWSRGYGQKSARTCKWTFVAGLALFAVFAILSSTLPKVSDTQASDKEKKVDSEITPPH